MKVSQNISLTVVAILMLVGLTSAAIMSSRAFDEQAESRNWVMRTYRGINQIESLLSSIKDIETGQRGYLITGQDAYLDPYNKATSSLEGQLQQLDDTLIDSPNQQVRLNTMRKKVKSRLETAATTIAIRRNQGFEPARSFVLSQKGKRQMDEVRAIANEMSKAEEELLQQRLDKLKTNTETTTTYTNALRILSLFIFLVGVGYLSHFLSKKQKAEKAVLLQNSVGKILNQSQELAQAINQIEQLLCQHGNWAVAATWILDEKKEFLKCLDIWTEPALKDSEFVRITKSRKFIQGEGLPGRVWQTQTPASIADIVVDKNFPRLSQGQEIHLVTGLAFPISYEKELLGVIEVFSKKRERLDTGDFASFQSIGFEIGQLIERERQRALVRQSDLRFRAIFDATYEFIGLMNPDGILLDANETALTFVGAKLIDVVGKPFWDTPWWAHSIEMQENVKAYVKRAAAGEFLRFEANSPDKNGVLFDFDVSIKPIFDEDGQVVLLIPEGRDISEKKQAETRVSEFYSTVSHELRTPLTSIRGSLGLIEGGITGPISEKTMKLIKIARVESDRLIRLISDILDLRKIEAGKLELRKTTVKAQSLVPRTIEGLEGMAQTADVELVAQVNANGDIDCDEDRILQALTNLVSNAIKFSPPKSKIALKLDALSGSKLRFSIIDNGPGIPEAEMHKLFGRFQQIDQSDSRQAGGTGLGLAITKAIVEEHGGTVGVESVVGKGTTFWIELSGVAEKQQAEVKGLQANNIHPALVVEDDESVAEVLGQHLSHDGFQVMRAKTLTEANEILAQFKPLIILLDLNLPDGDGLDLLAQLSTDEHRREIPVVIISARDKSGTKTYAYPALVDWLSKPFDEKSLHLAFNAAKNRIAPARVLLVEDDPSTRTVVRQQLETIGVHCIEASDGAEAIAAFRTSKPDLVILDLLMPPPDGFAVVDILSKEAHTHTPLIVYTSLDLNNEQKDRLQMGLTAYLTKGTTSEQQFIGVVREFLNGLLVKKTDAESST